MMPPITDVFPRVVPNHIGHIPPQKHWGMVEHVHPDFHEFILVLHGEIETKIRGTVLNGKRGDLLLYPAREPHAEQAVGDEPLETLFVGWQELPPPNPPEMPALSCPLPAPSRAEVPALSSAEVSLPKAEVPALSNAEVLALSCTLSWSKGEVLLVNDRSGRARMLLQWLLELSPLGGAADSRQAGVLMEALVYEYLQLAQPPEQHIVGLVKTYIQRHLAESITLDDLAVEAGFSRYHFSREFKRLTGIAPMTFVRQQRVEAARSLILSTPWTLQRIAEQVGFADETQLSRVFRRLIGVPPGQLRK